MMKKKSPRNVLMIADPWSTLDHANDSSIHLALVARHHFNVRCFWAHAGDIFLNNKELCVKIAGEVISNRHAPEGAVLKGCSAIAALDSFHSVHWRADPPVDLKTLRLWSLLAASPKPLLMINSAAAMLTWNEKFSAHRFVDWAVPALVSDSEEIWETFFSRIQKDKIIVRPAHRKSQIIAKPVANAASRGVIILPPSWHQARRILLRLQKENGPWLILQEFDQSIYHQGETRVFIIAAKVKGVLKKFPHPKSPIMNLDQTIKPTLSAGNLTRRQETRAGHIASILQKAGVVLATIDFIGDRILEINVTSPGLIRWLDENANTRLAMDYWKAVL